MYPINHILRALALSIRINVVIGYERFHFTTRFRLLEGAIKSVIEDRDLVKGASQQVGASRQLCF